MKKVGGAQTRDPGRGRAVYNAYDDLWNANRTHPPPGRALIVEDEPRIRELVALHLGFEGLACVESGDGDEALRLARAEALRPRRARPDAARAWTG